MRKSSTLLQLMLLSIFILGIQNIVTAQEKKEEEKEQVKEEKAVEQGQEAGEKSETRDVKATDAQEKKSTEEKAVADEQKKVSRWKNIIIGGINFSQTSYSNWAKGGQNSIAWNVSLDSDFRFTGEKWDWVIKNDMDFGMTKQEKEKPRTTLDKIDSDCTVICNATSFVNPYVSIGLLTQFTMGYDYSQDSPVAKSNFFDPAYLTQDIGARVNIKTVFSSHLGVGLKETITSVYNQYSDDTETDEVEKIKVETGISSKSNLNAKIFKKFQIKSELKLFKPFEKLEKVDLLEIDMNWNTKLTANITKFIVISLNVYMFYDKDVFNKIQVREVAGIGLKYQFI